jgi:hypothetical protein
VIVVAVIPITVMMPAVLMVIPPLLVLSPAAFPSFVQLMPPVICLWTAVSVVFDGFVEFVFRVPGLPGATVVSGRTRCASQEEPGGQGGDSQ